MGPAQDKIAIDVARLEERATQNERDHAELSKAIVDLVTVVRTLKESIDRRKGVSEFISWFIPMTLAVSIGILTTIGSGIKSDLQTRLSRLENLHLGDKK